MKYPFLIKQIRIVFLFLLAGHLLSSCHKSAMPGPGSSPDVGSQWTQLKAPNDTIAVLEASGNTLYAASGGNTLYISADEGVTWASSKVGGESDLMIQAIKVFNNMIYVGTDYRGVYSSGDGGKTWAAMGGDFETYPVTSFADKAGHLYAATQGNGVFILDPVSGGWIPFNNNLPQIITSYNVFKLLNSRDTLVAAAGVNGTFYYYDPAADQWTGTLLPKWGSYITGMIADSGTLYAVTTERKIIRSDNNGIGWYYDTQDLQPSPSGPYEHQKVLYAGTGKDYVITNIIRSGAWIQQRSRNAGAGSTWAAGQEFLKGFSIYAMVELDGKLFVGTDNGIYFKRIE